MRLLCMKRQSKEISQFEADYLPLQPAMQRMAECLLGNEDEAADVVQDCFVTLWSERESLKKVLNREAWCITLVKRRCVDIMRRRRPSVSIDAIADVADEDFSDRDELQQLAVTLIDRLPERQQQVLQMKHFDAVDTATIARTLQITEGNVYTILSRAYKSIKQMLLDYEKE